MRYINTKWKQEKIEDIMFNNGVKFKSNEEGTYYNSYFELYGRKVRIRILIYKTTINVDCGHSYWNGITSYKKLEEALKSFYNDRKKETWRDMNFAERVSYMANKEYKEYGTTECAEGIVNILGTSISNNLNELAHSVSNKKY